VRGDAGSEATKRFCLSGRPKRPRGERSIFEDEPQDERGKKKDYSERKAGPKGQYAPKTLYNTTKHSRTGLLSPTGKADRNGMRKATENQKKARRSPGERRLGKKSAGKGNVGQRTRPDRRH